MKISKSELYSALEDENNRTEGSDISGDEYLSDFKKLKLYIYEPCVSKSPWKKTAQEENDQIQKKTLVRLEILTGVLVVNTNQWLLIQKAFAVWINMEFMKVISKLYFHSFLK